MAERDLIDAYLARLRAGLRGKAAAKDAIVAELEDHLLEAVDELGARGVDARDAQLVALARLGYEQELARALSSRRLSLGRVGLATGAAGLAVLLVAVGAVVADPSGNDRALAHELGLRSERLQEPSGLEIAGVPLPAGVSVDSAFARELERRLSILDR